MKPLCLVLSLLALGACSSNQKTTSAAVGSVPLCAPGGQLGDVVVAPLTRWRSDQKEKGARAAIAQGAIGEAFKALSCASSVKVLPIAVDGNVSAKLAQAKTEGAETALLVRVDELGPIAILSFPALWSTWSDVKFELEAIDLASGQTTHRIEQHRKTGGAFQVRGCRAAPGRNGESSARSLHRTGRRLDFVVRRFTLLVEAWRQVSGARHGEEGGADARDEYRRVEDLQPRPQIPRTRPMPCLLAGRRQARGEKDQREASTLTASSWP